MAKGKDFYGNNVTDVIAQACQEFSASQEDLDIEVIETGSAGIFGLCKKKAHIRVTKKAGRSRPSESVEQETDSCKKPTEKKKRKPAKKTTAPAEKQAKTAAQEKEASRQPVSPSPADNKVPQKEPGDALPAAPQKEAVERELPSEEVLAQIREDIAKLLEVMGFASEVSVEMTESTISCRISDDHQEALVGSEGRTLDSLQYLLRKMMARHLPERMILSLNVGNYREQRADELKEQARELAEQVKADGKTQSIAALNPSERRVVHMVLQEDKAIRSRSVGEGLFKKVLIYKPGKKKKPARKNKSRQDGPSDKQ